MTKLNIAAMTTSMAPVKARVYQISFLIADKPMQVYNYLEDADYSVKPGEVVLRGTLGEEWRVPVEKLEKKYELLDGSPIDHSSLEAGVWHHCRTKESEDINWCLQVPMSDGSFEVVTEQGDLLKGNREGVAHGSGDYIFCCDNGGQPELSWGAWVVNGEVFENTYQPAEK